eukprot:GHUV01044380.1.p2 GENE.GHUV01044380.1~~GHUV01044380.1.p2  ORF type:complete len:158 (+),score=47.41 GHUV01044380.1:595-1068(+)
MFLLAHLTEWPHEPRIHTHACGSTLLSAGRDDPWVTRAWGHRLKRQLPEAQYLELAPAGHCPHHEAPAAVNNIIRTWVTAVEQGQHREHDLLQAGARVEYVESDGQVIEVTCQDVLPRTDIERWDYAQWKLSKAVAQVSSRAAAMFSKQQQGESASS